MALAFTASDVLACLALVLSLIATVNTIRFNSRQKSLIDSQERLNQRLLAREETDAEANTRADLSANLVRAGKGNWRLKVYNRGKAPARNVTIELPQGDDLLIMSDVNSKFPLELLEPAHGVELIALVHLGSASKHEVTLRWSDDFDTTNSKTVYPTI